MTPVSFPGGVIAALAAAGLLAVSFLRADPPVQPQKDPRRINLRNLKQFPARPAKFQTPAIFPKERKRAPPGQRTIVEVPLDVNITEQELDRDVQRRTKDKLRVRSYNGGLVGPAIRVFPGDLLKVKLHNRIPRTAADVSSGKVPSRSRGLNDQCP